MDLSLGPPVDAVAAARGQKLFVASCAFCHGSGATGGNGGPSLVRSVLVLHDGGTGTQIGPVILRGRTAKGMPKFPFSEPQIKDLAAFLLSRVQLVVNRMDYEIQNINTGNPTQGAAYFAKNCTSCHSPTGDLAHIAGKYDAVTLQARFLNPRPSGMAAQPNSVSPKLQRTVSVTTPSGEVVSGKLLHIDDFSVSLVDSSGTVRSFETYLTSGFRAEVHDPDAGHLALLPLYTNADMHNVFAYLETLK